MTKPGWFPDPLSSGELRWWDGVRWSSAVQPAPPAGSASEPLRVPLSAASLAPPAAPDPSPIRVPVPAWAPPPAAGGASFATPDPVAARGLGTTPSAEPAGRVSAWISLAFSIGAIITAVFVPASGFLLSAVSLVLAIIAMRRAAQTRRRWGLSITALVLAVVAWDTGILSFFAWSIIHA